MSHSTQSQSWIIKCTRFTNENKFSSFNTFHNKKKKRATFFQRDRILNSSRWICLVHVTRTSLLYLRDSHDQARVRLAIKVKVKSGNFQTPSLNHTGVPDLRYTEIGEILLYLENMTFYNYRYIDLSKKMDLFSLYLFIFFMNSILFFYFPMKYCFLLGKRSNYIAIISGRKFQTNLNFVFYNTRILYIVHLSTIMN